MINGLIRTFKFKTLKANKFIVICVSILLTWYLLLFPGRAGADAVGLLKLIRDGKSTDWWTSTYFWFIKITTFNGRTIALTSFVLLTLLAISFYWMIRVFPAPISSIRKSYLILISTPVFSVFGLSVGHDSLQVSGLLLLIGIEIRNYYGITIRRTKLAIVYLISFFCLLTTQTGILIIVLSLVILFVRKQILVTSILISITVSIYLWSSIGVSTSLFNGVVVTYTSEAKYAPILSDLKCVAQHPESDISSSEWKFLERISNHDNWIYPISCNNSDIFGGLPARTKKLDVNSYDLYRNYFSIVSKNPAIVVMAHIQRARGILPPPFFQSPDNQVILDTKIPIGQGTNTALQSGPELLHPSIDDSILKIEYPGQKKLEAIAQAPIFLFNQASWFWGWAGLWTWPIIIYWIWKLKIQKIRQFVITLYPLLTLNLLLFVAIPFSHSRYYMSAILIGLFVTVLMINEKLNNLSKIK